MLTDKRRIRSQNAVAKKIYDLIQTKRSNIVLSLDVADQNSFFRILNKTGNSIIGLKIHSDIIRNFDRAFLNRLLDCKKNDNFILIEDRKFADIGNMVKMQYMGGVFEIISWADLVTVHIFPGDGVITGLREAWLESNYKERGALLIPQMTSRNNHFGDSTINSAVALAQRYCDFVVGFIGAPQNDDLRQTSIETPLCKLKSASQSEFLIFTPGVHIHNSTDSLGQNYATPNNAIAEGSDCLIIGRGIYEASDPLEELSAYKEVAWQAFVKREEGKP